MEEIWKSVPSYQDYYEVSNFGRIRSLDRIVKIQQATRIYRGKEMFVGGGNRVELGEVRKTYLGSTGYPTVNLRRDGKRSTLMVHRVVAIVFLDNPNELPQVNHKDGNKENNHVDNLEWCTQHENVQHAFATLGHTGKGKTHYKYRPIKCRETGNVYHTLKEAAAAINMGVGTLHAKLVGRVANTTTLFYPS